MQRETRRFNVYTPKGSPLVLVEFTSFSQPDPLVVGSSEVEGVKTLVTESGTSVNCISEGVYETVARTPVRLRREL